nr:MAG TPA: hypothetical protein [Caudoviricetes sp.]
MVDFYEPRATSHGFFLGLRCGIPPRQTQSNNDAWGSPQHVAGRPPLLSVRAIVLHRMGQKGSGTAPAVSHTGDEACKIWQKVIKLYMC